MTNDIEGQSFILYKSVYNIPKLLTCALFYFLSKTLLTFRILQDIFLSGTYKGLKQGGVLSPLLFDFDSEHEIRKAPKKQVGLKLNGTHQLLVCADDMNLL
jgi:hypothetical protein